MEQSFGIRKTGITAVMIVVAALWTGLALAAAGEAQGGRPCADDAAKFCKDVQPGGGGIMRCLKEHENDLSPACKERVAGMEQWFQEVREACQDDAQKFCRDINPGSGRIVRCLKEHENELSPECKARMEKGKE
ncbi:MAG TPA: cysteine rich repeat-containing protein [Nitrospirota bacterium]|nr:cysteine rich repeat-containing protein [Nitrospirota bacterium]